LARVARIGRPLEPAVNLYKGRSERANNTAMLLASVGVLFAIQIVDASADDLCVRIGGGGGIAVIKSPPFQLQCCPFPAGEVNNCAPFSGFELGAIGMPDPGPGGGRITGSGCIDSQGNTFTYHYVYNNAAPIRPDLEGYFESGLCVFEMKGFTPTIERPASGRCRGMVLSGPTLPNHVHKPFVQPAFLWRCGNQNVPQTSVP
jgi:hypothetical protein